MFFGEDKKHFKALRPWKPKGPLGRVCTFVRICRSSWEGFFLFLFGLLLAVVFWVFPGPFHGAALATCSLISVVGIAWVAVGLLPYWVLENSFEEMSARRPEGTEEWNLYQKGSTLCLMPPYAGDGRRWEYRPETPVSWVLEQQETGEVQY